MYWSPSTKGFYDSPENYANFPADAIEISDDEYRACKGLPVYSDENGRPIPVNITLSANELGRVARLKRDQLLSMTDKFMLPDYPIDDDIRHRYLIYRSALRQVPEQQNFPQAIIWPEL